MSVPTSWAGILRKIGDRWAALEPIRAGVRLAFGGFAKGLARGGFGAQRLGAAVRR
ncbi:hypothetical protein BH23BAC4_BH23BAC4_12180 [soil metagenome]